LTNEPKKKKKNIFKTSIILKFLFFVADWMHRKIGAGFAAFMFTGYENSMKRYEKSFFYKTFQGYEPSRVKIPVRKLKKSIIGKCERSVAIRGIKKAVDRILSANLGTVGMFFASLGFYSSLMYLIKVYVQKDPGTMLIDLIAGIALTAFSALLVIFGKQSLYDSLYGSFICNALFFKFLRFPEKSESPKIASGRNPRTIKIICFSLGMAIGIMTYFIKTPLGSLTALCAAFAAAALLYSVLCCPEAGLLLFLAAVPFLPPGGLVLTGGGPCVLISLCYFLKLIRGKRTFEFGILDFFVLLFCALIFFGGAVSVAKSGSLRPALMYLCFTLIYFAAVNMIRSKEMIQRCVSALMFSGVIVAAYGIYQNYFGVADRTWQDSSMFSDISGRVVSTLENPNVLAEYLILVIPFMIVSIFIAGSAKKAAPYAAYTLLAAVCLIYTWSRGSWIGIIFALLMLFVIMNKKAIVAYLGILLLVPFAPAVLPNSIVQRIATIGDIADTSTSYRVSIWQATMKMIKDHMFWGIGVGQPAFKLVYPEYSLAGIENAPHSHNLYLQICVELGIVGLAVFLLAAFFILQYCFTAIKKTEEKYIKLLAAGGLCAVAGFLLNGFTDYVWYNYRVYLMFWLVVSITAAICRFGQKNQIPDNADGDRV